MDRTPPEAVFAAMLEDLPAGAFLTAAVGVVAYMVPGDDDDEERGPFLVWRCDGVAGRWVHLGMVETAAVGCRADLWTAADDAE